MNIINLTSHTLNEVTTGTAIPPSGIVVRVNQTPNKSAEYNGIPIYTTTYGDLEGLPEAKEGTIYIVSSMALNFVPDHRVDVLSTGFVKRDERGKAIGCVGFKTK